MIPTCGTPIEKISEFFYPHSKSIIQNGKSYIRYSIDEIKNISFIPAGTLLVIAGLHPNIPHDIGLKPLREVLEKRESQRIGTDYLIKTPKFVLQNNYFEFSSSMKEHVSETAIGTKFASPYACS